jgi:hypothetical protein
MASDRMMFSLAMAGLALSLSSAAVAKKAQPAQTDNFGEAVRQTMSAQIIDPNPQYDTAVPASSGEKAVAAADRYRTDKVKQPDNVASSKIGRQAASTSN